MRRQIIIAAFAVTSIVYVWASDQTTVQRVAYTRPWPVVAVMMIFIAAACGEPSDQAELSSKDASAEELRVALGTGLSRVGLDALLLSDSARRQELIAECMGEAGFEYAQTHGYGVVADFLAPLPSVVDPDNAIIDGLSAAAVGPWQSSRDDCSKAADRSRGIVNHGTILG